METNSGNSSSWLVDNLAILFTFLFSLLICWCVKSVTVKTKAPEGNHKVNSNAAFTLDYTVS